MDDNKPLESSEEETPLKKQKSFEELFIEYENTDYGSDEEAFAVEAAFEAATTFDELFLLASTFDPFGGERPQLSTNLIEKLTSLAITRENWQRIWNLSPFDSDMEKRAEEEIRKLKK